MASKDHTDKEEVIEVALGEFLYLTFGGHTFQYRCIKSPSYSGKGCKNRCAIPEKLCRAMNCSRYGRDDAQEIEFEFVGKIEK